MSAAIPATTKVDMETAFHEGVSTMIFIISVVYIRAIITPEASYV